MIVAQTTKLCLSSTGDVPIYRRVNLVFAYAKKLRKYRSF